MRTAAIYIASFVLSMIAALPGSVYAQTAQPTIASLETTPIGKIVSAKGVVTVEHTQASGRSSGRYRADWCGQGR
jgi:hypothetical protein